MTLIIGIQCDDGVVIGADGAATLGALGTRTVQQPVKKLNNIANSLIVGIAGPVGMGQIFTGEIGDMWAKNAFKNKQPHEASIFIVDGITSNVPQ